MEGLHTMSAINAWAASPECKAIVSKAKANGGPSDARPFTLRETKGQTFCVYADGTEKLLGT
jgi:hypothetical protein